MRLQTYLNEGFYPEDTTNLKYASLVSSDFLEMIKILKKDCSKYITLLGSREPFIRKVKIVLDEGKLYKVDTPSDRRPKGTDMEDFYLINKFLKKNGHNDRNEHVTFAGRKTNMILVSNWTSCYVFPIGDFSYTWIPITDFNKKIAMLKGYLSTILGVYLRNRYDPLFKENYLWGLYGGEATVLGIITEKEKQIIISKNYDEDFYHKIINKYDKFFLSFFHTDEGITTAADEDYEIWFKCKSYYLVNQSGFMI